LGVPPAGKYLSTAIALSNAAVALSPARGAWLYRSRKPQKRTQLFIINYQLLIINY